MEMIGQAIVGVLRSGKRVVIPGLGAFLRKEGDRKVVFVEFLKKDDGVLSGLLIEQYGLSAREVQEAVGGFVGDLQRMVNTSGGFVIEGLGVMRIDANGVLDLQYDPSVKAAVQVVEPEPVAPPEEEILGVSEEEFEIVAPAQETAARSMAAPSAPQVIEFEQASSSVPQDDDPMVVEFEPLQRAPKPAARPVAPSAFDPDEDGSAADEGDELDRMIYHKPPRRTRTEGKKQTDLIMIIAIVAAAIAILAMIYGRVAEKKRNRLPETPPTEQVVDSTLEAAGNI